MNLIQIGKIAFIAILVTYTFGCGKKDAPSVASPTRTNPPTTSTNPPGVECVFPTRPNPDQTTVTSPVVSQASPTLEGAWTSQCLDLTGNPRYSFTRHTVTIRANRMRLDREYFTSTGCPPSDAFLAGSSYGADIQNYRINSSYQQIQRYDVIAFDYSQIQSTIVPAIPVVPGVLNVPAIPILSTLVSQNIVSLTLKDGKKMMYFGNRVDAAQGNRPTSINFTEAFTQIRD